MYQIFDKCVQMCAEIRSALCCSGCDAVQAILVTFIQTECSLSADLRKAFKPWAITDEMNVLLPDNFTQLTFDTPGLLTSEK